MNYDEYGETVEPYDPDTMDDEEEYDSPPRRPRVTASISWQQIAFIVTLNAIISLIISLAVVIVAGANPALQSGAGIPADVPVAQTEAGPGGQTVPETNPGQPTSANMPAGASTGAIPTAQPVPAEGQPQATSLGPTSYVVQPGDTLTSIADRFDVSLEDLMRANDLSDPDYVQVGQQLIIPIGGLPDRKSVV